MDAAFDRTYTFHVAQCDTARRVVKNFTQDPVHPYVILLAQMQSGKTGTYLRVGLQMMMDISVRRVMIITGNSDLSLRGQTTQDTLNAISQFSNEHGLTAHQDRTLRENVTVHFGQDLKKIPELKDDTLVIWDECHMAQSDENRPYKEFFGRFGLRDTLQGNFQVLRDRNIRILSVSATPFSELVCNQKVILDVHADEEKRAMDKREHGPEAKVVVTMADSDEYHGLSEIHEDGRLKFSAKSMNRDSGHLAGIMRDNRAKYTNKYVIVRTRNTLADTTGILQGVRRRNGYDYRHFFGGDVHHEMFTADGFGAMKTRPERPTLIHLCGKARMGQVVPKEHIGFVYEQSELPNTDTILQSLVGRMCGYPTDDGKKFTGDIYLSGSTKEEVSKYIEFWDNHEEHPEDFLVCKKAMNISHRENVNSDKTYILDKDGKVWEKLVPMKVFYEVLERDNGEQTITDYREVDSSMLENLLESSPDTFERCNTLDKVRKALRDVGGERLHTRDTTGAGRRGAGNSQADADTKLEYAYKKRNRETFWTDFVAEKTTDEVKPLIVVKARPKKAGGEAAKHFYLVGAVLTDHPVSVMKIPQVAKKCVHAQHTKPVPGPMRQSGGGARSEFNAVSRPLPTGGQMIVLPPQVSTNPEMFKMKLQECVDRTILGNPGYIEGAVKSINGLLVKGTKKGIYLKRDAYPANFEETITREFAARGVSIKFNLKPGRKEQRLVEYYIFSTITWS